MNLKKYIPKKSPAQWVLLMALAGVVIYYTYKHYKLNNALRESGRYTVGKVYWKDTVGTKGGNEYPIKVRYSINNRNYNVGYRLDWSQKQYQIGDSIFVHFLPKDPSRAMLLIENPPPKNICKIPPKGWKELPKGPQEE